MRSRRRAAPRRRPPASLARRIALAVVLAPVISGGLAGLVGGVYIWYVVLTAPQPQLCAAGWCANWAGGSLLIWQPTPSPYPYMCASQYQMCAYGTGPSTGSASAAP